MTDSMPVSQDVLLENLRRMAESLSNPNLQMDSPIPPEVSSQLALQTSVANKAKAAAAQHQLQHQMTATAAAMPNVTMQQQQQQQSSTLSLVGAVNKHGMEAQTVLYNERHSNMNGAVGLNSDPSSSSDGEMDDDEDDHYVYDDDFDDDEIENFEDNTTKVLNEDNHNRSNNLSVDIHSANKAALSTPLIINSANRVPESIRIDNRNDLYKHNMNVSKATATATTAVHQDLKTSHTINVSENTSTAIHQNTANNTALSATSTAVSKIGTGSYPVSFTSAAAASLPLSKYATTAKIQSCSSIVERQTVSTKILKQSVSISGSDNEEDESAMICSECGTEFTDVQSYMSHGCVQSSEESNDCAKNSAMSKSNFADGRHDTRETEMEVDKSNTHDIPSDAESFDGKIVYNPDGSAYIIEGDESDSETESMLNVPNKEGIIIDQKGRVNTSQVPSFPQIANAFYIQKNPAFYNAWYSMLPPENRPHSEAPIMHSYRVFDVRLKLETESSEDQASPKTAKVVDLTSGDITSVPTKPILMCFICKLSFGYAKSFVSHALTEHRMNLNEEEKCYLSRKNASAIIQSIGKSKDPLMSFLEPVSPPLNKPNSFISNHMFNSKLKTTPSNNTNVSFVYSGSKVTPIEQKTSISNSDTNTSLKSTHNMPRNVMISQNHSKGGTIPSAFAKVSETVEQEMDMEDYEDSLSSTDNLHSSNGSSFSMKSPSSTSHRGIPSSFAYDNNSPVRRDINSSLHLNVSSNKYHQHQSPSNRSNSNSPGSSAIVGPPPLTSPIPGLSSIPSTSLSPKMSLPNIPIPPLVPVSSGANGSTVNSSGGGNTPVNPNAPVQGIVIRAGCEDHPNGNISGEECLKCESVLGTARHHIGNQMTMMHSRNSCKTLKCPKCNWHYKYQETLEIHMKEKHPDNDTQCIYCITKQPHPRLARGEVYTCGYKPYRCEVCNYSTTTKGNLSIHMQSDKHINNMQELQKAQTGGGGPNSQQPQTPTTPNGSHMNHIISPISSGSIEVQIPPTTPPICSTPILNRDGGSLMKSGGSSGSGIELKSNPAAAAAAAAASKPKPSWRCDVCNYETNVARNLRIHMTSEKHTHNMMMLQQNVKHMQRDMHFQLNQMAFMGQDPTMMFGLPSPLGPGLQPFPFDPSMMMASGMPPNQLPDGPMDLTKPEVDHGSINCIDFKNNNEPSKLFNCAICEGYSADSLESLHGHMQLDRTKHGNEEHVTVMNGTYICNLCQYKTNLKANFQLHCKTDKHLQRLQLVNHIREGCRNNNSKDNNEWQMKYFANISNPVQVRCNACNYYTNSIHKLQLHNSTPRHEQNANLFHHLQKREGEVASEKKYYKCTLCQTNSKSKLGLIEHVKSMTHMRNESIKILQLQELGKEIELNAEAIFLVKELHDDDDLKFEEDIRPLISCDSELSPPDLTGFPRGGGLLPNELFPQFSSSSANVAMHLPSMPTTTTIKDEPRDHSSEKLYSCQYCKFSSASEDRLEMHIKSAHFGSVSEAPKEMACPLCQEKYSERSKIEHHLVEVHNVSKEGLQRLMIIFDSHPSNSSNGTSSSGTSTPSKTSSATKSSASSSSCFPSASSSFAIGHYPSNNHSSPPTLISAPMMLNGPIASPSSAVEKVSNISKASLTSSPHHLSASATNRIMSMSLGGSGAPTEEQLMMVDDSDPMAEMMENHALKLAEEASKDGIVWSEIGNNKEHADSQQLFRCQTCAKTFQNIDHLYNHQNELGHLELKQTPGGPGYLCWKKGCNQYFKTAQKLQVHFREIHAKKPVSSSNMSVSEKHAYKYRCKQCSLAFKTVEKLQMHSYYHIIRNATMCFMCSKRFRTIAAMRKHMELTHLDSMTAAEKEKYAQNLTATAPLAYLGLPGIESGFPPLVAMQQNPALQALQAFQQGLPMSLPMPMPSFFGLPNISMSGLLNQQAENLRAGMPSLESPTKPLKEDAGLGSMSRVATPGSVKSNEQNNPPSEDSSEEEIKESIVGESINTIALAENSFNDPSKKYKCFRCKVAFAKQGLLIQHNRTLMHRNKSRGNGGNNNYKSLPKSGNSIGEEKSRSSEYGEEETEMKDKLYNDPSRPYKCEYCEESFVDRNTVQIHLSSHTHLNTLERLRQNKENDKKRIDYETMTLQKLQDDTNLNMKALDMDRKSKSMMKMNSDIVRPSPSSSAGTAASSAKKSSLSANNGDKSQNQSSDKPYKCNICKVAYNQSGTLDIHLSSAVHQAKASKIEELIITGEVDMTQPLIEKPEIAPQISPPSQEQNRAVLQEMMKQTAMAGMPQLPFSQAAVAAAAAGFMGGFPGFMGLPGSPLGAMMTSQGGFFPPISFAGSDALYSNSGSTTGSPGLNIFSSGSNMMMKNDRSIYTMADNTSKSNIVAAAYGSNHKEASSEQLKSFANSINVSLPGKTSTPIKDKAASQDAFICEKCNGQYNTAQNLVQHQQMYCLMQMTSLRMKLHAQRGVLENIGFECVMQYNENNQKSQKKLKKVINGEEGCSGEKKLCNTDDLLLGENANRMEVDEHDTSTSAPASLMFVTDKNGNEKMEIGDKVKALSSSLKKSEVLPEMEKMVCKKCNKEFSSVWVLKAHQEEIHRDIVSTDLVSVVADKFREDFDRKYPLGIMGEAGCNMDVAALVENSITGNSSVSGTGGVSVGNNKDIITPVQGSVKTEEPQVSKLADDLASAQAAQMMQMPMFNIMSGMMPMPMSMQVGMNMAPPMMSMMLPMGQNPNEMMGVHGMQMLDPNMMNSQGQNSPANQAAAAAAANSLAAQQQKRGRTRISDDQLKVLRNHFDINNSPSEEQIMKMSEQTGLPPKVIKHWFRNTLFKERQRNKDSPYNFSNPPSTQLNLEEYEKTGKVSVSQASSTITMPTTAEQVSPITKATTPSQLLTTNINNNSKHNDTNIEAATIPQQEPKPIVIIPEKLKDIPDVSSNNNNVIIPHSLASSSSVKTEDNQDKESVSTGEGFRNITSSASLLSPANMFSSIASMSTASTLTSSGGTSSIPVSMPPLISVNPSNPSLQSLANNPLMNNFNAAAMSFGMGFPPMMNPLAGNAMELSAAFAKAFGGGGAPAISTPDKMSGADMKLMSPDYRRLSSSDAEGMGHSTPGQSPNNAANFLSSRRANRTRFSDYQLKLLQEYFEQNAYPKDDDLDHLSKLLGLSPRVIVVWFQNARQKARKSYENNPPTSLAQIEDDSKFNRTPGLNYQCKRCFTVFQRYYELIRHQKTRCYKDEEDERSETNLSSYTQDDDSMSDEEGRMRFTPLGTQSSSRDLSGPMTPKSDSSDRVPSQYECEKCTAVFSRFEQWNEHQKMHLLNPSVLPPGVLGPGSNEAAFAAAAAAAAAAGVNPFNSFPPILPALPTAQQIHAHLASIKQEDMMSAKRKYEEDEYDHDENGQKRMRTTILPEQLDYLYQQYQLDCNPSRKQLEAIADHVGLKKRVVQVWFQNTRARERKGQYRAHTQLIHKRCPFCRALFRAKSALESHLASKHPEEMARTQVNIDAIPDEPIDSLAGSSEGGSAPTTPTPSSVPNLDMAKLLNNPYNMPNQFMPIMPGGGSQDDPLQASMKQLYEESLKRYMADMSGVNMSGVNMSGVKEEVGRHERHVSGGRDSEEIPLDLSKPSYCLKDENDEFLSDNESDDDNVHVSITDSGPPSPSSTTSSTPNINSPQDKNSASMMNIPPKRYRTQLSALQVKIMKSIYQYYKTPTMTECEILGRQLGHLAKRVIQVWFQNARAKEKKAKSQYPNYSPELDIPTPPEQCKLCNFKYTHQYTIQDHLFSRRHIENVSAHIRSTDHEVANESSRTMWEKNEVAAMTQMNVQAAAALQGMGGLPSGSSTKTKDLEEFKENKNMKSEKHTAKKPETNTNFAFPPGSATSSVAALMNPFSGLAGMPPGMMEMGAAAMAAQAAAAAGMLPFMMPPNPGAGGGSGSVMPPNHGAAMGAMGMPFMPPGMMPGPEMFLYDPTTFGTPLTLLQIPPAAIKSVQSKLQDEGCVITRYTQDCKNLADLKPMVSANDFSCATETMVDVGFICRKCKMVYPGKEACVTHQQMVCYQGKSAAAVSQDRTIVKLEQIQMDCRVCDMKFSTLQEYQVHCDMDVHRQKMKKR